MCGRSTGLSWWPLVLLHAAAILSRVLELEALVSASSVGDGA